MQFLLQDRGVKSLKEELALFGGTPVRSTPLQYGKQSIDQEDIEAVVRCMQGDYLTTGPAVQEFENQLAQAVGAKYAVAVSNGTAALHVACIAAGIKPGDEIITTPLTFAASANCACYCGATPVFADVDIETFQISPESIEEHITPNTKAIIPVHYAGISCDMDAISEIAVRHNLIVIEDAAHAIGTAYKGRPVGSISDMTEFSFHPVKTITTGEGGAVTTNNKELYQKLQLYRTHGITRNPELLMDHNQGGWYYEMLGLGYNYRITDLQCALGSSQLKKLDGFKKRRKELVEKYNDAFKDETLFTIPKNPDYSESTRHLYPIRLNFDKLSAGRKEVFQALWAEGIGVNVHYIPVYWFPYYQQKGYQRGLCPNAEEIYEGLITLPLFSGMNDYDLNDVVCAVQKVTAYYKK